jgi:hypothetical protein
MCALLKVLIKEITAIICWTLPPHFKRAVCFFNDKKCFFLSFTKPGA